MMAQATLGVGHIVTSSYPLKCPREWNTRVTGDAWHIASFKRFGGAYNQLLRTSSASLVMSEAASREKTSALREAASSGQALSPLVQLLPTGYRDIQPFQRGQGWHSNGKVSKLRRSRENAERVVFPVIPGQLPTVDTRIEPRDGPNASVVDGNGSSREEDDVNEPSANSISAQDVSPPVSVISPIAATIPTPPSAPRRPSSGSRAQSNQHGSSSSGSFRTRTLAASTQNAASSSSDASLTTPRGKTATMNEEEYPSPDPATMEKLWQEYNERTKHPTKTVDKDTYHRKMHHRYNEMKSLRERVASLESELEEVRSERDEARDISRRNSVMVDRWKSKTDEEPSGESDGLPNTEERCGTSQVPIERSASTLSIPQPATSPRSKQDSGISAEELTLREKCFKLERSLALAKETIDRLQAKILSLHNSDQSKIDELRAKLQLEQEASQVLAVQLRETNAAFKTATDELVATQNALDKEREERQVAIEQIQAETKQFITDHKRKELQSRVKSVVRTLGKEALRQKMEALHTRTLMAEHHMRAAQLELAKLKAEREYQQAELDAILASREIKYHCLAPDDGGIQGILGRSTILYHGTRLVNDQYLLVRMLYEDNRASITKSIIDGTTREPVTDLEDGFSVHFIVYEAFTAQDDYLTFHLRDIQRLVPDCEKYLATFADRRHERYLELAELLFSQCHIGYKNGHLVLTERPSSALEAASRERTEVTIYRGSRFVTVADSDTSILVDLVVNEVYTPSMSQLWWLEIQATTIDTGHESVLKVDYQLLKSCCATFASYRPSESVGSDMVDEYELYGVHEELLESVFNQVQWHPTTASLWIESALTEELSDERQECALQPQDPDSKENPPVIPTESRPKSTHLESSDTAQVLDHRSIVGVEGIFYCLRIQELWDGELMLRITMEEPDTTTEGYEMVLCERQLVEIAAYLFRSGLCDEDHSRIVKYGLPGSLHGPMARVLKKYLRPLRNEMCGDTSVICSPAKQSTCKKQKISLASLLAEMTQNSDSDDPISTKWIKLPAPCRLLGRSFQEVQTVGGSPSEEAIQAMFNDLQENPTLLTRRERFGCRYETKCDFATVTTYSGFPKAPERILLSVCPLESSAVLLVLTQGPVLEALASLGLRWTS